LGWRLDGNREDTDKAFFIDDDTSFDSCDSFVHIDHDHDISFLTIDEDDDDDGDEEDDDDDDDDDDDEEEEPKEGKKKTVRRKRKRRSCHWVFIWWKKEVSWTDWNWHHHHQSSSRVLLHQ
jgi:hypothetical protein